MSRVPTHPDDIFTMKIVDHFCKKIGVDIDVSTPKRFDVKGAHIGACSYLDGRKLKIDIFPNFYKVTQYEKFRIVVHELAHLVLFSEFKRPVLERWLEHGAEFARALAVSHYITGFDYQTPKDIYIDFYDSAAVYSEKIQAYIDERMRLENPLSEHNFTQHCYIGIYANIS